MMININNLVNIMNALAEDDEIQQLQSKVAELEAEIAGQFDYKIKCMQLTAKLDKAREALHNISNNWSEADAIAVNAIRELDKGNKMTKQIKAFVEANKIVSEQGKWAEEAWDELMEEEALAETQEPVPIAILHRKRLEVYNPKLTVHEKAAVTFLNVDETDRESNMRYQSLADGDYKLYTTPPSREWVGLSDEEIIEKYVPIWGAMINTRDREETVDFARAIEAKLRERNND